MENKLIIWVDLEKAEANSYSVEDITKCAKFIIDSFQSGKTAIGLPMEYKNFFSFETIKVDDDAEIEINFIEKEKKENDDDNENNQ